MTVFAPPRPPAPSRQLSDDDAAAIEALREQALIEEARRRARRRRRVYAAGAVVAGVASLSLYGSVTRGGGGHSIAADDGGPPVTSGKPHRLHNGKIAFYVRGRIDASRPYGGPVQTLVRCPPTNETCDIPSFVWSHDGRYLAFLRGRAGGAITRSSYALFVADANGHHTTRYVSCGACGMQYGSWLSWSPDDATIALTDDLGLVLVDVKTGRRHSFAPCTVVCADVNPTWSPDGSKIAFGQGGFLFVASSVGTDVHPVATTTFNVGHPSWSPNGMQIAFESGDTIYRVNTDGTQLTRLLEGEGGSGPGVPSWSPEGNRILYFNTPGSSGAFSAEVWVMNADGTHQHRLYQSGPGVGTWAAPEWSADGKRVAFSADTAQGLIVMNADGSGRRVLSPGASTFAWQPLR